MSLNLIIRNVCVASLYAVLTFLLAPISYGAVQFRISEILILLILFNKKYLPGLVIGCLIANLGSGAPIDLIFGTLATLIALLLMMPFKNMFIACIFPVIVNAVIVGLELRYFIIGTGELWYLMLTVGIGEFVVLYFIGIPVMLSVNNNKLLHDKLDSNLETKNTNLSFLLYFGLVAILFLLYNFMPFNGTDNFLFKMINDKSYLIYLVIFSFIILYLLTFIKNKILFNVFFSIISIALLVFFILLSVSYPNIVSYMTYYLVIILSLVMLFIIYYMKNYKLEKKEI